jgi:hypothetical protein
MKKPKIKHHLRRKISALAIMGPLMVGAVLTLPKAQADPPPSVSGDFEICDFTILTIRQAGRFNFVATGSQTQTFTGDLVGALAITADRPEHDVIRTADGTLNTVLSVTFHGSGTFTGSILGSAEGMAVMSYAGRIAADGTGVAYWVIDQGTGGLDGVHGQGTFTAAPNPVTGCTDGTYAGQIQFAP